MAIAQLTHSVLPGGKGFDPTKNSGYQIQGCSSGLTDDARQALEEICVHYGNVVREQAPQAARDAETKWRSQGVGGAVPSDILSLFTPVLSYSQVSPQTYALVKTVYSGLTHEGRPGNYFAHALAFVPEALESVGFNAAAVARTGVLRTSDPLNANALPPLSSLGTAEPNPKAFQVLLGQPYRSHMADMAMGLMAAAAANRSVLVFPAKMEDGPGLVEGLLSLLPPAFRARTTFCSYEGDFRWIPKGLSKLTPQGSAAHHLIIAWSDENGGVRLRDDEYNTKYAVFNFRGNRFSTTPSPSRYMNFALRCVEKDRADVLFRFQDTLHKLGADTDPDVWERLCDIAPLFTGGNAETLGKAVQALADYAATTPAASAAADIALPRLQDSLKKKDYDVVRAICLSLAPLAARNNHVGSTLRSWAADEFRQGHYVVSDTLVAATGERRETGALGVVREVLGDARLGFPRDISPADAKVATKMLVDAAVAAFRAPEDPEAARILVFVFEASVHMGRQNEVWEQLGESLVLRRLKALPERDAQRFARELSEILTARVCPEASLQLGLALLQSGDAEDVQKCLNGLAQTLGKGSGNEAQLKALLEKVRLLSGASPVNEAVMIGRMVDATDGSVVQRGLFDAYRGAIKTASPAHRDEIRSRLAAANAPRALALDAVRDLARLNKQEAKESLRRWRGQVFARCSGAEEALSAHVARALSEKPGTEMPLVEVLLEEAPRPLKPGVIALVNAAIRAMPLTPSGNSLQALVMQARREDLDNDVAAKMDMIGVLTKVKTSAAKGRLSLGSFPADQVLFSQWQRAMQVLSPKDQEESLNQCVDAFRPSGITEAADAEALVQLFGNRAAQEAQHIADLVLALLTQHDTVTRVNAVAAFVRCGVRKHTTKPWCEIVARIIGGLERADRDAFEKHLSGGFWPKSTELQEFMNLLRPNLTGKGPFAEKPGASGATIPHGKKPVEDGSLADAPEQEKKGFFGSLLRRKE